MLLRQSDALPSAHEGDQSETKKAQTGYIPGTGATGGFACGAVGATTAGSGGLTTAGLLTTEAVPTSACVDADEIPQAPVS